VALGDLWKVAPIRTTRRETPTMTRKTGSAALLVLLVTLALLMAACADSSNSNTHGNTNAGNANGSMASNALSSGDRDFMTKAAIGGMEEVELGRMAAQKGASNDVKQFGQHMVDDHSKANDELKSLAAQKNVTLPTALDQQHQGDVDRLTKMTGAAFDREYMSMMVKDHVEDVADFEREAASGADADVKQWAGRTVPTLRQHLQMAQDTAAKVGASGGATPAAGGTANQNIAGAANHNAAGNRNAGGNRNGNANRRP
jgi:putative membrane protein